MDHLYIVTYDICDPGTWRVVFRLMKGYGEWVQLSVFQCRLDALRHAEMIADLDRVIEHGEDHVVVFDLGPADSVRPRVVNLGKGSFTPVDHKVTIV